MMSGDSVQIFSDKFLENMGDVFRTLYTEEQLSDVTIHCKQGSIKAHKLILAANSPYFYRIFKENGKDNPIIILYGITLNQLRNLMDLLYLGKVDVFNCDIEAVTSLVQEFEIKGVVFASDISNNVRLELNQGLSSPENAHNMHTRFKGQKRVAVDFSYEDDKSTNLSINIENRPAKRANQEETLTVKNELPSPVPSNDGNDGNSDDSTIEIAKITVKKQDINAEIFKKKPTMEMMPKLSAWAKKQRKFKCHLCPSSFKRSSHLSRHQLVHTGERPFSCNQCDKAFSRHDKLKHHIRRAHEFIPDSMYERIDNEEIDVENDLETNDRMEVSEQRVKVRTDSRTETSVENFQRENSPLFTISHITSILEDSFVKPPKKGRGRPRKYPIAPAPIIKRGRGRPKLGQGVQNYDSTNLPYGDLNYLTRPSSVETAMMDDVHGPVFLEPLVEIKTEQNETPSSKNSTRNEIEDVKNRKSYMERASIEPVVESKTRNDPSVNDVDISEIETKIGLIGECTISVAN